MEIPKITLPNLISALEEAHTFQTAIALRDKFIQENREITEYLYNLDYTVLPGFILAYHCFCNAMINKEVEDLEYLFKGRL